MKDGNIDLIDIIFGHIKFYDNAFILKLLCYYVYIYIKKNIYLFYLN